MPHPSKGKVAHRGKRISRTEFARLWLDPKVTVAGIAAQLEISKSAVLCRAAARKLPKRMEAGVIIRPRKITDPEFPAMYQARVRTCDLCALYDVSHPMLNRTAKRLGIPKRNLKNGGGSITLEEYRAMKLREAMAATARDERSRWGLAGMIDGTATSGRWAA